MAAIHQSTMTLRFFGDELEPDEITVRLNCSPSDTRTKGRAWETAGGIERIARTGLWRLKTVDRKPGDIDGQVAEILTQLSDDLSIWADLTTRFQADLFCGLFMRESNEGITLSPSTMREIGARNLEICFDVYDPGTPD